MTGTFRIGLTMAGAISAGAYTGGVFDFLMEALDEWEKEKHRLRKEGVPVDQWPVPCHQVVIPVMSGASAGGITGALGLVALAEAQPADFAGQNHTYPQVGTVTTRLPRLYDAWVRIPCFVAPSNPGDGRKRPSDLLGTEDLDEGPVRSLLDTTVLSRIVDASLTGIKQPRDRLPYLSDGTHLFLTHASLRGVPYEIKFAGGGPNQPGYPMMCHADRVHFRFFGLGSPQEISPWADPDPSRAMKAGDLIGLPAESFLKPPLGTALTEPAQASLDGWRDYAVAALGTGAFPIGLRSRGIVKGTVGDYRARRWPIRRKVPGGYDYTLQPSFPPALRSRPDALVEYVTVDGGTINNEPFELARWALMECPPHQNVREGDQADRAVIMIDPFPAPPDYDASGLLEDGLATVIRKIFPMLVNQARFKVQDMVDALDEDTYSRFLVAPVRKTAKGVEPEPFAIACGLLGGFGGFLSEEFRAHDYQLGRLNCYLFLKDHFALPEDNRVVKAGYPGEKARAEHAAADDGGKRHFRIIPLTGSAKINEDDPSVWPKWPRVKRDEIEAMVARAKTRGAAVFGKLIKEQMPSRIGRTAARLAWFFYGKGKVEDYVRWAVLQDLLRRDQISELIPGKASPTVGTKDVAKVFAGLANPAFDLRTAEGVAKEHHLSVEAVRRILASEAKPYLWMSGDTKDRSPTFCFTERKPGWLKRLPVFKELDEAIWSGPPVVS